MKNLLSVLVLILISSLFNKPLYANEKILKLLKEGGKVVFIRHAYAPGNGDPDNFLYVLLDKSSAIIPAQNIAFYRNNELHEILIKARTTFLRNERTKLYYDAQRIIF